MWHYIMLKGNWKLNLWDLYSIVSNTPIYIDLGTHYIPQNILQRSIMTYIPQIYKHNVPYPTANASYQGSLSTRK